METAKIIVKSLEYSKSGKGFLPWEAMIKRRAWGLLRVRNVLFLTLVVVTRTYIP